MHHHRVWWYLCSTQHTTSLCFCACAGRLGPAGDFRVVWPTVEEVKNSVEGWFAGCSIPGALCCLYSIFQFILQHVASIRFFGMCHLCCSLRACLCMQEPREAAFAAGTHANVLKTDKGLSTPILQPFWCRFDGAPATAGRQHAMPHIKSYLRHSCALKLTIKYLGTILSQYFTSRHL